MRTASRLVGAIEGKISRHAAKFAKENPSYSVSEAEIEAAATESLAPLDRGATKVGPFPLQLELQTLMQNKVGIAREEAGLSDAIDEIRVIRDQLGQVGACGNRWYNPGWHTALDMKHLLTVSEAIAVSARERKESRGAHSRLDHPGKGAAWSTFNHIVRKGPDGDMVIERRDIEAIRPELQDIIEEQG